MHFITIKTYTLGIILFYPILIFKGFSFVISNTCYSLVKNL